MKTLSLFGAVNATQSSQLWHELKKLFFSRTFFFWYSKGYYVVSWIKGWDLVFRKIQKIKFSSGKAFETY